MSVDGEGRTVGLDLNGLRVTDSDVKSLAEFPRLAKLTLTSPAATPESLKHLRKLARLKEVAWHAEGTLDVAALAAELAQLPNLRRVSITAHIRHSEELARLPVRLPGVDVSWEVFHP